MNNHPFGEIVSQCLNRKRGLSQSKLASGILQDPAVISRMCKGERLTGAQARERVVSIIDWFDEQGVLETIAEANALLEAAGMARLRAGNSEEAQLLKRLERLQKDLGHSGTEEIVSQTVESSLITPANEGSSVSLSPAEAKERHNLGILLRKVKQFWIEGVLQKSIHTSLLLELGKELDVEVVQHPWEQVLELPDRGRRTLPAGQDIGDLFEELNRALLILGEPGSGKTITLLELARSLIIRCEHDETGSQPVPVIFNLSTWVRGQPLIDWLADELATKYLIPRHIGRTWLENNRLLPLLDDLNEVEPAHRTACVEAINHFGENYGLPGLAVCSRLAEYTALQPARLKLNGAVRLQPLMPQQIDDYLKMAGPKLANLRASLLTDQALQSLAQSPLMLNIMSLAYQDAEHMTNEVPQTVEARRNRLVNTYIAQMFERRGAAESAYTHEKTVAWLSWLAQQMSERHQTIFLTDRLQPSWITRPAWRRFYALGSRLSSGLVVGLSIGLYASLFVGLWDGLPVGLSMGLLVGLFDTFWFARRHKNMPINRDLPRWRSAVSVFSMSWFVLSLLGGLLMGLVFGHKGTLDAGIFFVLGVERYSLRSAVIGGLFGGLIYGIILGLIFGIRNSRQSLTDDIKPVEALSWSWRRGIKGVLIGLTAGLSVGFGIGMLVEPATGQVYGVSFGIFLSLLGGLTYGLSSRVIVTKTRSNHGIWLSIRNAIFTGLLAGLFGGFSFGSLARLITGDAFGVYAGLCFGLSFGLLAALWYGGFDIIQHYILRLTLWQEKDMPFNYTRFLDYATNLIFLQKVGGGYIFTHRLLMAHFSSLKE